MDANTFTTHQKVIMELSSLSSIDIEDAKDELLRRGVREPSWEQAVDMMTNMRTTFSNLFYQELRKLAV